MVKLIRSFSSISSVLLAIGVCLVSIITLSGCDNNTISTHNNTAAVAPELLEQYIKAIDQMANNNSNGAETTFTELISLIEKEDQTSELQELRADIDYALGKLALDNAAYNHAYDYFNSAFIRYKNLLQDNADKTVDARIRLAEIECSYLGRNEHALQEYLEIYENCNNRI